MSSLRYSFENNYDDADSQAVTFIEPIDTINRLRNANGFFVADVPGNGDYLYDFNGLDPLPIATTSLFADFGESSVALRFTGGDRGDVLITGTGDDILNGGAGNDILEAGIGQNAIDGGLGTNTLNYANFTAAVEINPGQFYGIGIDMQSGTAADNTGSVLFDTFTNISNVRATAFEDSVDGDNANNVIEGGGSADFLDGHGGIDTLSYAHSSAGVVVSLADGTASGGDAQGDVFSRFENLLGSSLADTLIGDWDNNTINGNGGSDTLYGFDGNDRLIIDGTPDLVDGGDGKDVLIVTSGAVVLTDATFGGIESVYLRGEASLDMSGVTTGTRIVSQSSADLTIVGTSGADRIQVNRGSNTIEGGAGADKIFAGGRDTTLHVEAGFGRDNVYGFDAYRDHITVDIAGVDASDLKLTSFHAGQDTIVTFAGVESGNKIILHDVTVDDVRAVQSELFTFGA